MLETYEDFVREQCAIIEEIQSGCTIEFLSIYIESFIFECLLKYCNTNDIRFSDLIEDDSFKSLINNRAKDIDFYDVLLYRCRKGAIRGVCICTNHITTFGLK